MKQCFCKKRLLSILALLTVMSVAYGQDAIKVSTSVDNPEHMFTIVNGNNLTLTSYTSPTETPENAGKFAFYASNNSNAYLIYSLDRKKWVSYDKAASYNDNCRNFVILEDSKDNAQPWMTSETTSHSGHYQFAPITTAGTAAAAYMNLNGGKDFNPLDNTEITIGLWRQNGNDDAGSRYILKEVQVYTYTVVLSEGSVYINDKSYSNGDEVTVVGLLSPSSVIATQKENQFAVANVDNDAMTISVTYYSMPELRESAPYTQAWVYPKQQDEVGVAKLDNDEKVYTLYNNVLAASFINTGKAIYFLGSKAMDLVAGTELFIVGFGNGDKVTASQMELKSLETKNLVADEYAIGGAKHFAGKALEAVFAYSYKGEEIEIIWRAVLRDGSHYLRTEMELTGKGNVDMYDIIAMTYNVDANAAGSKPVAIGNTRGKVIMNNKIFAGLETPTAYNTAGGSDNVEEEGYKLVSTPVKDNIQASAWKQMASSEVPMRINEVGGSDKTYYTYTKEVELKKDQKVVVTLTYTSGNKRFDIDGTVLLDANGDIVASDYHHGYSGSAKENNTYSFNVPNDGTFSVRMFCDNREGAIESSSEFKVEVYEAKAGVEIMTDIVNIEGRWSRNVVLKAGETWKVGAVVGLIAQDGTQAESDIRKTQKRRSFLAYSERERAVPWRAFPCYISWYELNINRNNAAPGLEHTNMQVESVLDVISQWKTQLFDKYGVAPKSFMIDDGWDEYGTWTFHSGFPNEMKDMAANAADMNAGVGAWLGPVGGYGQSGNYRRQYWSDKGGMQLSNPAYYETFLNAAENLVVNQHIDGKGEYNFFKFDGISGQFTSVGPDAGDTGNENAEGIIRLEQYVRENLKEDIFFNTTVGTWASPFWYQISDATWRQENDHDRIGNNSINRENWITYRDNLVHQNYVTRSPICPINTLMTHGFMLTKNGPPASDSREYKYILNEMRCAFACGSGLVELYNDYDLMNTIENGKLWSDLADCIRWQEANADVLMDAHWVGGDPWTGSKAEIYGWAAWNGTKSTFTLRNGANGEQTITITLREALEIPANYNGSIKLSKAFADQAALSGLKEEEPINIDDTLTLTLPGSSVYIFNGIGEEFPTVGIEDITSDKAENNNEDGSIYDLSGRKVEKAEHGIYISNGKKVLF